MFGSVLCRELYVTVYTAFKTYPPRTTLRSLGRVIFKFCSCLHACVPESVARLTRSAVGVRACVVVYFCPRPSVCRSGSCKNTGI